MLAQCACHPSSLLHAPYPSRSQTAWQRTSRDQKIIYRRSLRGVLLPEARCIQAGVDVCASWPLRARGQRRHEARATRSLFAMRRTHKQGCLIQVEPKAPKAQVCCRGGAAHDRRDEGDCSLFGQYAARIVVCFVLLSRPNRIHGDLNH